MATQAAAPPVPGVAAQIEKQPDGTFRYVHGPVSFTIDNDDIAVALKQADEIGQGQSKLLAEANGLSTEPWSYKLARPVVLSFVQLVWHRHHGQPEDALVKIIKWQDARVEHYNRGLEELRKKPAPKPKPISDAVRAGRGGGTKVAGSGAAKAAQVYRLRADRADIWGKFTTGQKAVLVKKLQELGQASSSALAKALEADGFKANQPTERITSFYYAEWNRNGLLEAVETTPAVETAAAKPEEPKVDVSKVETKPKQQQKKK